MKQSDYNPNQPYDSELLARTAKVLTDDQRIELYNNGDDTAEIRVFNWETGTDIVIGILI